MDNWELMTDANKRRWAFEKLELFGRMASMHEERPSDEELFARADRLVAYINGQHAASPSPSHEHLDPLPTEDTPYRQLAEAI